LMCGVELGGTKCECLVGTAPDDIRERITVRTERDAAATLHRIAGILRDWKMRHGTFSALGLACFGPLDLRPDSPDFGRIGMTPKEGWRNVDVAGFFADRFADAVGMTTDVIAAALAARTGTLPANLPADSPVWETVAHALAQLAHHLVLTLSPQRILIGGGVVSERTHLFPRIRERLRLSINDYLDIERAAGPLEEYIVPPGLGTLAGPLGALAVAADAGSSSSKRPFTRARS